MVKSPGWQHRRGDWRRFGRARRRFARHHVARYVREEGPKELGASFAFGVIGAWLSYLITRTPETPKLRLSHFVIGLLCMFVGWLALVGIVFLFHWVRSPVAFARVLTDKRRVAQRLLRDRATWDRGRQEFGRVMLAGMKSIGVTVLEHMPASTLRLLAWKHIWFDKWEPLALKAAEHACGPTGHGRLLQPKPHGEPTPIEMRAIVERMLSVLDELMKEQGHSAAFYYPQRASRP